MMSKGFAISLTLAALITLFVSANTSHDGFLGYVVGFCVGIGIIVINNLLIE